MPVQKKTSIYFAIQLSLREIYFIVYVHALMTRKSCAVRMRNAILRNHLKYSFHKQSLTIIINSLVFSKLFYCSCIWSNTCQTNLKMLQTVQYFACHIVSGRRKYDHVSPALKNCAGCQLRSIFTTVMP